METEDDEIAAPRMTFAEFKEQEQARLKAKPPSAPKLGPKHRVYVRPWLTPEEFRQMRERSARAYESQVYLGESEESVRRIASLSRQRHRSNRK